nr:ankyrin repeat domain containing protein [Mimivirus sp.]
MSRQNILLDYCKKSNNHQDIYNFIINEDISDKLIIETISNLNENKSLCDLLRSCLKIDIPDAKYDQLIDPYKLKNLCKLQDYAGIKNYIYLHDITEYDIKDSFEIISRQINPDLSILDLFISHYLWNDKLQNTIIHNLISLDLFHIINFIFSILDIEITRDMINICMCYQKYDIFEFFINRINNVSEFINKYNLMYQVTRYSDNRFFNLLLDLGGNINDALTFCLAILDNNKYCVQKIIEHGYWSSNCDYVHMVIRESNADILDILLENNFNYDLDTINELIKNMDGSRVDNFINTLLKYGIYISLTE